MTASQTLQFSSPAAARQTAAIELHGIQMLRALAAIIVVFHHCLECSLLARVGPRSPDWFTTFGAAGVDVFFVISGLIMTYTAFSPGRSVPRPGAFLFRRVTRIYPLYWLCLAAALALGALHLLKRSQFTAIEALGAAALLPSPDPIIGVTWTLSFEMLFYLLFAATLPARSAVRSAIGIAAILTIAWLVGRSIPYRPAGFFLGDPITAEFVFGVGLGIAMLSGWLPKVGTGWSVPAFGLIAVAPMFVWHPSTGGLTEWRVGAWGVPAAVIVASFVLITKPKRLLGRALVVLGDASYAIYLMQFFGIGVYARLLRKTSLGDVPQYWIVPLAVCAMTAIGLATHLVVERNLLRAIRRVTHRQPGHAVPA